MRYFSQAAKNSVFHFMRREMCVLSNKQHRFKAGERNWKNVKTISKFPAVHCVRILQQISDLILPISSVFLHEILYRLCRVHKKTSFGWFPAKIRHLVTLWNFPWLEMELAFFVFKSFSPFSARPEGVDDRFDTTRVTDFGFLFLKQLVSFTQTGVLFEKCLGY